MESSNASEETKIIYHIDCEDTPYLVKIPIPPDKVTLADFKAFVNKPNFKYYFKQVDADFGYVKEEITDDSAVLPEFNGRVVSWLEPAKGSDGSASDGGGSGSICTDGALDHHPPHIPRPLPPNDDLTTETESVISVPPVRRPGRLNGHHHHHHQQHSGRMGGVRGSAAAGGGMAPIGYESSILSSECETNSMLDTTDDDTTTRFSSSTERSNFPSRMMNPAARPRRPKKRRKPFPRRMGDRASSFSSITDSTMSLNIITVTLSMDTTNFLGISIVGQTHKQGDGGIYVGTIMPGGAVAHDGKIEPGDMILQVNEYSFENMSNDDAVRILRDVVNRPGPIKLVVAKCWNPNPQSYFTLPKNDPASQRQLDPSGWVEQTRLMQMQTRGGGGSGPMSPSLASVTSDGSSLSSLPESSILYPGRTESTNFLLAAGGNPPHAPPPSQSAGQGYGGPASDGGGGGDKLQSHQLSVAGSDVASVLRAMQTSNSGLEIKDRMWLKITIPNAFLGHSLVDWLYEHLEGFSDRREARKYAGKLLKDGFIKHTTGKASFSEQCYYIFNSDFVLQHGGNNNHHHPPPHHHAAQKQRDPVELDEENDVLTALPHQQPPWGNVPYFGYAPQTAGYQQQPPQQMYPTNELDSFGPMGGGGGQLDNSAMNRLGGGGGSAGSGHSSPGSSNSSNRSERKSRGGGGGGVLSSKNGGGSSAHVSSNGGGGGGGLMNDSLSDLEPPPRSMLAAQSYRGAPSLTSSNEFFVDPM